MKKVFIDGSAGTTGLRIFERLQTDKELELITLNEKDRKDPACRKQALNLADIAILCLPDDAAREAAGWVLNPNTVVLDTSTAHRTAPGWVYGFPELSAAQKAAVCSAKRIAVPGCHASGFIALTAPLVQAGLLPKTAQLTCFSLTGYSGGGKKMIAEYTAPARSKLFEAPRQYALPQQHKHLAEMQAQTGLPAPAFCPVVGDFYSGMQVTVPLFANQLAPGTTPANIAEVYRQQFGGPLVQYATELGENGFLSAAALSGYDSMKIAVSGNSSRILLLALYDNLGKGASGAAIECLNLALGRPPEQGLRL